MTAYSSMAAALDHSRPAPRPLISTDSTASAIRRARGGQSLAQTVGDAPAFLKVMSKLPALAGGDAPVLITGETGTGKELTARAIHHLSDRASFPFIPINCGALPDTLLEDELFGHERGAFTDARDRRAGLIKQAERGTLFLDEVDSLTSRAQVVLLRVLQEKAVRALGAATEEAVNVRFIAATKIPLRYLAERGAFRHDLYYRLNVLPIDLPPLRERREDILRLARHFLVKHAPLGASPLELSPAAAAALLTFEWPGNVRELENTIIRGIRLAQTSMIERDDLELPSLGDDKPEPVDEGGLSPRSFKEQKRGVLLAFERDYLTRLMVEHGGNVTQAARTAGKDRRDLGKLLKKHQLDVQDFRREMVTRAARMAVDRSRFDANDYRAVSAEV
jgi:DNA-binding NtrC family response regulator